MRVLCSIDVAGGFGGSVFGTPSKTLLLPSFAVIVLGTIGSIPGAIVASLIVGFVRALSSPILIGIGSPLERSNYTAMAVSYTRLTLPTILLV